MASPVVLSHKLHEAAMQRLDEEGELEEEEDVQGKVNVEVSSSSPLVEFLFFHKAIRAELERLHRDALAVENGSEVEFKALLDRYRFLRSIYKHHSSAEDEVIFPALDLRVKNVAQAYSLEHKVESKLFDQMSELLKSAMKLRGNASVELRRELICCTEAIKTTLFQHLSKEEEQVFPLLMVHFTFDEQAALVWQFICSIPVNLIEKFLPWLASSLTKDEQQQMVSCLENIVPEEELLQQVVFAWVKGGSISHGVKDQNRVEGKSEISSDVTCSYQSGNHGVDADQPPKTAYEDVREYDRKRCEPDIGQELARIGSPSKSGSMRFPINELLYWHTAIRKELREFAEEARKLELAGTISSANLTSFVERLQFLAEVCNFHSAAEDKVLFPAVNQKVKHRVSFALDHAHEERQFDDFLCLLEGIQNAQHLSLVPAQLYAKLCSQAEAMVKSIKKHFLEEEREVLPLARKHFSIEEQRTILYQSLRVMPLKFLERVLPWLVRVLSEEEAKDMFHNMRLAAPVADKALVTLFTGWACKGHPKKLSNTGTFMCISSRECPGMKTNRMLADNKGNSSDKQISANSQEIYEKRPLKRFRGNRNEEAALNRGESDLVESSTARSTCRFETQSCCVPGLGCSSIGAKANGTSLRPLSIGSASPLLSNSLSNGLFGWGSPISGSGAGLVPKPIDHIFQFHKAIRKDLEYLDVESARLADCQDEFLRHFSGRFQFLWGLYRAHSNAEDDIVFPALEAKEALHNVSHSYTIDHKQEEQLFEDISRVLSELSHLHNHSLLVPPGTPGIEARCEDSSLENMSRRRDLAGKLQRMCKSVRVSLDQHVSREELELWPLFDVHFTIEEQDKIVGQIIGTTGAEVLQAMLPWVTTALTEQEHNTMMDTWRQATRNTMFDKWLSAWWKETPLAVPCAGVPGRDSTVPPSGSNESLQIVADYLASGATEGTDVVMVNVESRSKELAGLVEGNSYNSVPAKADLDGHVNLVGESSSCNLEIGNRKDGSNDHLHGNNRTKVVGDGSETFKPGWRDIFRMNQKELEAAIRKVSSDSSLDPRRKAYLMQNLMTSRWIVAQQQLPNHQSGEAVDGLKYPGQSPSFHDEEKQVYGCEHYKRNCKIRAACCGLLFTCRFCHDKVSDHSMDRHATKEMMCMKCLKVQPVGAHCVTPSCCDFSMARYFCSICKFFDNDDRDIYHCPFCNLCRVGKGLGQDYFHCMTCNSCMSMSLSVHTCREKGLESNCPICHDFLFTSNTPVKELPCGHFMHSACFKAYTCSHYTCPICSKSVGDMAVFFGMLDALLAAEQLPDEYQNRHQDILCNDCGEKGTTPFHWLYHKCQLCGSYNTRTI